MIATTTDCNVSYHYYDAPMAGTIWDDIKAMARLSNLEACRWILKYLVNWPLPVEPILKRNRKNNRMMFFKRGLPAFNILELIMFVLIWG